MKTVPWSQAERAELRDRYGRQSAAKIAETLFRKTGVRRSVEGVRKKAFKMGLNSRSPKGLIPLQVAASNLDIPFETVRTAAIRGSFPTTRRPGGRFVTPAQVKTLVEWFDPAGPWTTPKVMARRLGISLQHCYNLLRVGVVKAELRGTWRVNRADLERFASEILQSGAIRLDLTPYPGCEAYRERQREWRRISRERRAA